MEYTRCSRCNSGHLRRQSLPKRNRSSPPAATAYYVRSRSSSCIAVVVIAILATSLCTPVAAAFLLPAHAQGAPLLRVPPHAISALRSTDDRGSPEPTTDTKSKNPRTTPGPGDAAKGFDGGTTTRPPVSKPTENAVLKDAGTPSTVTASTNPSTGSPPIPATNTADVKSSAPPPSTSESVNSVESQPHDSPGASAKDESSTTTSAVGETQEKRDSKSRALSLGLGLGLTGLALISAVTACFAVPRFRRRRSGEPQIPSDEQLSRDPGSGLDRLSNATHPEDDKDPEAFTPASSFTDKPGCGPPLIGGWPNLGSSKTTTQDESLATILDSPDPPLEFSPAPDLTLPTLDDASENASRFADPPSTPLDVSSDRYNPPPGRNSFTSASEFQPTGSLWASADEFEQPMI